MCSICIQMVNDAFLTACRHSFYYMYILLIFSIRMVVFVVVVILLMISFTLIFSSIRLGFRIWLSIVNELMFSVKIVWILNDLTLINWRPMKDVNVHKNERILIICCFEKVLCLLIYKFAAFCIIYGLLPHL